MKRRGLVKCEGTDPFTGRQCQSLVQPGKTCHWCRNSLKGWRDNPEATNTLKGRQRRQEAA